MAAVGAIATLTLFGAFAFVVLVIGNWYYFHRQEMGFLEWLRHATSGQRLFALIDSIFIVVSALEFLEVLLIFLI